MMKKLDNGYMIFDTIYIGEDEKPSSAGLVLRLEKGVDVVYHTDTMIIDYPGEYELAGYNVIAFQTKNQNTLNYIIRYGTKKVAYIQHTNALDEDDITAMNTWFVANESIKEAIERREIGGDIVILE